MWVIALIIGVFISVFIVAALHAGDCEDCTLKAYRDDEEDENK